MKIVFTAAVMDLLHRGHINLLRAMRAEAGDGKVIVVLHDDRSTWLNKGIVPVQSLRRRFDCIQVTELVDTTHICTELTPEKNFRELVSEARRNGHELLFMRGDDWKDFPARAVLEELNVPMKIISYTKDVSSTLLREDLRTRP